MEEIVFRPERNQYAYTFGGVKPVMNVKPGSVMRLWSEDAFNFALTSVDDMPSEKIDIRYVNPQTGPFYVEGAEPGDTLVLHIVDLEPARDFGASSTIPFFGGLSATDRTAMLHDSLPEATWIYHVDKAKNQVGFQARFGNQEFALPIETMLGTVGVAPPANEVRTSLVPERFGGNMDSPEVKVGTTIYLGVNVEGAMFSIGDGHYRQGEGESCGTAVEGAMNSVILVELIKGHAPLWPRLESDDYWMVVGSSRPMEDAWRISQVEMIHWLGDILGLHYMDAYQLVTQVTLAPIANCVDTNYSVVTKIPKGILPKSTAFEGMHARLRELAKSVK
ncbi:MAG TPA: acetamidase [Microbacteriaceae bacterium]|nr:acetamidase [Microbacteriaceae bacterium]